jgi:hypothetical protein
VRWPFYTLPILIALTAAVVFYAFNSGPDTNDPVAGVNATPVGAQETPASSTPPQTETQTGTQTQTPVAQTSAAPPDPALVAAGALPEGGTFTTHGDGTFTVVKGTTKAVGAGRLYRYDIEIEKGLAGVDAPYFSQMVQAVLTGKQSWAGHGDVRLERVDSGPVDFHISLASTDTVHKYCGDSVPVETSCYVTKGTNGVDADRVLLSIARWVRGSRSYGGDLTDYRIYMFNHEVGHAIGRGHAHECLPGGEAPVMMPQTLGLQSALTGQTCTANPWPYPPGVKGAPGAEQPDTDQNTLLELNGD